MSVSTNSDTRTKTIERTVCLQGITDVMFDRYPGDNSTKLAWHQKVYLRPGTQELCLPAMNIVSFLSSHNTNSAPKRLRESKVFKKIANACLSFVVISPVDKSHGQFLQFLRDDKPIVMGTPDIDRDEQSGLYLHRAVARLDKGIPNPKERPTLPAPWSIKFRLMIIPNQEIKEQEVRNLIVEGGLAIGLGTFRGVFGKFVVSQWE